MSFLAPGFLALAAAAAAVVVALHFYARQRPRAALLPTARFVPDLAARAPSRASRPADLLLLLLRVLAVLLVGAAFARPVLDLGRRPVARIFVVDRSRAVRSPLGVRDTVRSRLAAGDLVVLFDSAARVVREGALDALAPGAGGARRGGADLDVATAALAPAGPRGSLSAAFALALRSAPLVAPGSDSIELVVISPLVDEEWDAATADLRRLWRGRVTLVPVAAAETRPVAAVDLRGDVADPLRATLGLAGRSLRGSAGNTGAVRLVRDRLTPADSAWARAGGVLVFWPANGPETAGGPGTATGTLDTVGAVVAEGAVLVAPFARVRGVAGGEGGLVVARWVDGAPAAVERSLGAGCERDVAIPVALRGDLALRAAAQHLVAALTAPCGGARRLAPLPDSLTNVLRGAGALWPSRSVPRREAHLVPASAWLLAAALLGLLAESALRTRTAKP